MLLTHSEDSKLMLLTALGGKILQMRKTNVKKGGSIPVYLWFDVHLTVSVHCGLTTNLRLLGMFNQMKCFSLSHVY